MKDRYPLEIMIAKNSSKIVIHLISDLCSHCFMQYGENIHI